MKGEIRLLTDLVKMTDTLPGYMKILNKRDKFDHYRRKNIYFADTTTFIIQMVKEKLRDIPSPVVLDYGCGNGTLGALSTGGSKVLNGMVIEGFDLDTENGLATYHSLEEIGNKRFDMVLISNVVEHCSLPEVCDMLRWSSEHADKILVSTPNEGENLFCQFYLDITHVRPYNKPDFLFMLDYYGFKSIEVYKTDLLKSKRQLFFSLMTSTSPLLNYIVYAEK